MGLHDPPSPNNGNMSYFLGKTGKYAHSGGHFSQNANIPLFSPVFEEFIDTLFVPKLPLGQSYIRFTKRDHQFSGIFKLAGWTKIGSKMGIAWSRQDDLGKLECK
eukprot:NODE_3089_length_414_cov_89.526027_g2468_i0.p1 GENE.NODE_3089_length_414_cov_89.526027_g2468_i0~~NODE_3089_length_414_cov_89.526027_g2468_i0.p1  ORF type:complete len:105 (+),score=9.44 NODE_3089_length_414_cov_89.526027_g2468_i0:34-348(+)